MAELRQILQHLELAAQAYGVDLTLAVPTLPPRRPAAPASATPVVAAPAAPAAPARLAPTPGETTLLAPAGPPDPVEAAFAALRREIQACTRCALHQGREHAVPGEGNPRAEVLFLGEAPGASEDKTGRPFVGPSGQLLDRILAGAMGLQRSDVYIANVAKCHPPGNRNPEPHEVAACLPFLTRQLALVRPKVIVCLGRVAAQNLLGASESVSKLRGRDLCHDGIPVVVTWHPAYLLREPAAKRDTWEDIKRVNRLLGRPEVPKSPGA
ncbi:MAG: uracil-DNA glycosylase [Planctomycetes bacterium]|nr:uracil-DNA glycosylase [Planctomycetota bacterium]